MVLSTPDGQPGVLREEAFSNNYHHFMGTGRLSLLELILPLLDLQPVGLQPRHLLQPRESLYHRTTGLTIVLFSLLVVTRGGLEVQEHGLG